MSDGREDPSGDADVTGRLLLGGLVLAALGLRIAELGRAPLWVDEAATWWYGRLVAAGELSAQVLEPTPPLYYAFVGWWMRLFGDSAFSMRLPSVLAGVAAVPLVFYVGRELFDRRAAWTAAVLMALHPLHVATSREARVYPFLVLVVLGSLAALVRGMRTDRTGAWAVLAALLATAGWMHPYGVFLIATSGLLVVLASRGRARRRGVLAVGVGGLLVLPWWVASLPHLQASGAAWSVRELYGLLPEEARLGRTLEISLVGAAYNPLLRDLDVPPTPAPVRWPAVLVQLGLLAALSAARHRDPTRRRSVVLLLGAWAGLVLVPWTITRLGPPIFHLGRHDVYALGPVTLLLAAGWAEIASRRRVLAAVLALVVVTAAGHRLRALARFEPDTAARRAGRHLAVNAGADDVVLALGIRRLVTEHPARRAGAGAEFRSFPSETDSHPGWSDDRELARRLPELRREAEETVARLEEDGSGLFVLTRDLGTVEDGIPTLVRLVDGQLLEVLRARGWQPDAARSSAALEILALDPPGPVRRARGAADGGGTEAGVRPGPEEAPWPVD